jgi:hypothetical protein
MMLHRNCDVYLFMFIVFAIINYLQHQKSNGGGMGFIKC